MEEMGKQRNERVIKGDYHMRKIKKNSKKIMLILLAMAVCLSTLPLTAFGEDGTEDTDNGLILRNVPTEDIQAGGKEYIISTSVDIHGLEMPEYVKKVTYADDYMALVLLDSKFKAEDLAEALLLQDGGVIVQPNLTYESTGQNDPYYGEQWGMLNLDYGVDIKFDQLKSFVQKNSGYMREAVVAIIDTGFDFTHPDLAGSTWVNKKEIAGNGKDDDGNGYKDDIYGYDFANSRPLYSKPTSVIEYDHGTHCAGTIGATGDNGQGVAGIASVGGKVKMMSLKVLAGPEGGGSTFDIIRAIRYAEANGAKICNLSLGGYYNDQMLYNAMAKSKMLFVCAAGNEGYDVGIKHCYPACYSLSNIISVANIKKNGALYKSIYYGSSNYSTKCVDLAAPGTDIFSTIPGNKYDMMSGTSMSAPYVTGVAALTYSYYKGITASQMRALLRNTVTKTSGLSTKVATGGYVNGYKALTSKSRTNYLPDVTAPKLTLSWSTVKGTYKKRLNIAATDNSGKLPTVRYARGSKDLAYFKSGNGFTIKLGTTGKATRLCGVPGIYTVYARDGAGNRTIVKVKCTANAPSSIKLNYTGKTLQKGKYFYLKATLSKAGKYGRTVTYTSSNKSIATVSSSGKVVAKKRGTVYITAKTGNLLTARCKVTVK